MASFDAPLTDAAFGAVLRDLRERREMTLEQVSARMRELGEPLAVTVLSRVERGARPARASEVVAFARVLGMSAGELLDAATPNAAISRADDGITAAWERTQGAAGDLARALAQRVQVSPDDFDVFALVHARQPLHISLPDGTRNLVQGALGLAELGRLVDVGEDDFRA